MGETHLTYCVHKIDKFNIRSSIMAVRGNLKWLEKNGAREASVRHPSTVNPKLFRMGSGNLSRVHVRITRTLQVEGLEQGVVYFVVSAGAAAAVPFHFCREHGRPVFVAVSPARHDEQ